MTSINFVAYVVHSVPLQWQGGGKLLPRSCRFPDKSNGYAEAKKLFINNALSLSFRRCQIVDAGDLRGKYHRASGSVVPLLMPSGGSVALAKECSAVLLGAGACFLRGDKALSPELPELELQDRHSGFSIEGSRF